MAITFEPPKTLDEKLAIERELEVYRRKYANNHPKYINEEGMPVIKKKRMKTVFKLYIKGTKRFVGSYTVKELAGVLGRSKEFTSKLANNVADGVRPYLLTRFGVCFVERGEEERNPDE